MIMNINTDELTTLSNAGEINNGFNVPMFDVKTKTNYKLEIL